MVASESTGVTNRARPGFILSAMAAIFGLLVLLPLVGILIVLYNNNALTLANIWGVLWISVVALVSALSSGLPITVFLAVPTAMTFVVAIVFLVAFFFRARWGPSVLTALALIWAVAVDASKILVPLLGMSGSMPLLTVLSMIPSLVAPVVFALGFAGFLLHGDVARAWFRAGPSDCSLQKPRAGRQ